MATHEKIVLDVLKESGCYGQNNMLTPAQLIDKCREGGIEDVRSIEAAVVTLIDQDILEYEMDDDCNTSQIWLIDA